MTPTTRSNKLAAIKASKLPVSGAGRATGPVVHLVVLVVVGAEVVGGDGTAVGLLALGLDARVGRCRRLLAAGGDGGGGGVRHHERGHHGEDAVLRLRARRRGARGRLHAGRRLAEALAPAALQQLALLALIRQVAFYYNVVL